MSDPQSGHNPSASIPAASPPPTPPTPVRFDTSYQSPNYDVRTSSVISAIVIHSDEGASAIGSLTWLCNPRSVVSSHYYVCRDGRIYQLVDDSKRAWHAGAGVIGDDHDPNSVSLGIECEHHQSQDWPALQHDTLTALCQYLISRYPAITPDRVVSHRACALPPGRKIDPTDWPEPAFRAWAASLIEEHA